MEWFANWFDSEYYHLLYQHRDETEAGAFIDALGDYLGLQPEKSVKILDLACGKGRHSKHLARNFPHSEVLGVDLSPQSIQAAGKAADTPPNCRFDVHDMRLPLLEKYGNFDLILNLFTSFGYFEDEATHVSVLQHIKDALTPEGQLVIDFFNPRPIIQNLVLSEQKTAIWAQNGTEKPLIFDIQRWLENGRLIKEIKVRDSDQTYTFREQVWAFRLADFERFFATVGLTLRATFGNYQLAPFDPLHSPRLIFVLSRS